MRSALIVAALAVVAGLGGYAAYHLLLGHEHGSVVGREAPAITLRDIQGRDHSLAQLRGKWVLINFWASWCAPCMDELPLLVEAQKRYGARGLQILGPALDDAEAVAPIVQRFAINYPVSADFLSADAAMQALGNGKGGLPYTVLIDPQGRVDEIVLGALDAEELAALLRGRFGG